MTDPLGATTSYERDAFGRVVGIIDPLGNRIGYTYTAEGKLTARTRPDGGTEQWSYDGEGNPVEHVDVTGTVTQTEIGPFDLPAARTGPGGGRTVFDYDTELRLTAVTNPQGLTWRYVYDPAGRLMAETDFNGRLLRYDYDAAGQLTHRTNGAGEIISYVRDPLGNVIEQRAGDAVSTFTFDGAGRVIRARNADADVRLDRDPLGRVLAETCNGRTVTSTYDLLGRRTHRRTPSGAESRWEYDASGRPTALRAGVEHAVQFGYDAAGREVKRHLGPHTTLGQTWDDDSRLRSQTLVGPAPGAGQQLLQHRAFRYRPDGVLLGIDDHLTGDRSYDLDPSGRITAVTGPQWTERYVYDLAGKITTASWQGAGTEAAQGPREYTGTLIRRAGHVRYEHDQQGRVVLRQQRRLSGKPLTWRYEWDANDRMTAVTTPTGQRWHYRYDPFGRRIAKQRLDADRTVLEQLDFSWDDTQLAEQSHVDWWPGLRQPIASEVTAWDWQPGTFQPISQRRRSTEPDSPQDWFDREFWSIVTDLTGTPAELVSAAGEVGWQARASLWGAAQPVAGTSVDCPLRFPGQYYDAETALNYNYQRYYDPAGAQYQSPDPLGLAPGPNDHAYVANPITLIDPLGLTPCEIYRGMTPDGDVPKLGDSARTLGARPGTDIPVEGGVVRPETGGMSVSPDTPANLPPHRRPPSLGGTGKDPVWNMNSNDLPDGLTYRPDPANPAGHGFVEPSRPMTYDEYQSLIHSTQGQWSPVKS